MGRILRIICVIPLVRVIRLSPSLCVRNVILKYGGLKVHRQAIFFFLGLVLGDFTLRSVWSIVSLIINVYMPSSGAGWN